MLNVPTFIFATCNICHYSKFCYYLAEFDFKYFHQDPHLILLPTFSPLLIILPITWLNFDFKAVNCAEMYIMGNDNDPSTHIQSWKFSDDEREFKWP